MAIEDDYTEEEIAGMSPDEQAALEDGLEEGSGDDDAFENDLEEDDSNDNEEPEDKGSNDEDPDDAEEETTADSDEDQDADNPFVTKLDASVAEDIASQLTELDDVFEAGDISLSDYNAQRDNLRDEQIMAKMAEKHNEQSADQLWDWQQNRFYGDHSEYESDPIRFGALDSALRTLYQEESNTGKEGDWFLNEAHKLVEASMGKSPGNDDPVADTNKKTVTTKTNSRSKEVDVPKTLANMPAADDNQVTDSKYNVLDKLEGMDLESALAGMSDKDRDNYLRA